MYVCICMCALLYVSVSVYTDVCTRAWVYAQRSKEDASFCRAEDAGAYETDAWFSLRVLCS